MSQFARKRVAKDDRTGSSEDGDRELAELSDHDADEEDLEAAHEADEDREAADEGLLDNLEREQPDLVLTREEIKAGQIALEKVCVCSWCTFSTPRLTLVTTHRS